MLERGRYLVHNVTACFSCHANHDLNRYGAPMTPGTLGAGQEAWGPELGMPGTITFPNITPHYLGDWTDGEILRAMTCGVSKDGRALPPMMPYDAYKHLSVEDAHAIIAYIRTLPSIESEHGPSELIFPLNFIFSTLPADNELVASTPQKGTVDYGKYLTHVGGCIVCHTPLTEQGGPDFERTFEGGHPFIMHTGGITYSANITPDNETGLGKWTSEQFVAKFAAYRNQKAMARPVAQNEYNTPMPWYTYANMTDEDLAAIFSYLQSLPAKKHEIEKFDPDGKLEH